MAKELPLYVPHDGTVKISGTTQPRGAGRCAYYYLRRGWPVEFFCIGANANQQAMKSMGVFGELVKEDPEYKGKFVAFVPERVRTSTLDGSGHEKDKDATVWKTVLVG
jgi:hypothetical protein